jgi:ubiquinone/menaquinone biosynthesis C-methylase UbiE
METVSWHSAHSELESKTHVRLRGKLYRLGVADLPKDSVILDTCCGSGSALAELHSLGFKNLHGIDSSGHLEWQGRPFHLISGDARQLPFPDNHFDAVTNIHALHHLGGPSGTEAFLKECYRVLKPGGRLFILDFPASPQIRFIFWALRKRLLTWTPYLHTFAKVLDEEWSYLGPYLAAWKETKRNLFNGDFAVERFQQNFFLYYLCLRK